MLEPCIVFTPSPLVFLIRGQRLACLDLASQPESAPQLVGPHAASSESSVVRGSQALLPVLLSASRAAHARPTGQETHVLPVSSGSLCSWHAWHVKLVSTLETAPLRQSMQLAAPGICSFPSSQRWHGLAFATRSRSRK